MIVDPVLSTAMACLICSSLRRPSKPWRIHRILSFQQPASARCSGLVDAVLVLVLSVLWWLRAKRAYPLGGLGVHSRGTNKYKYNGPQNAQQLALWPAQSVQLCNYPLQIFY